MIELEGVPELIDPVMVAAFEGWNDAGDAASTAVAHLDREWKGEVFAALDAEDYYDFQVNRPTLWLDGGVRKITWPTTRLSVVRVGGRSPAISSWSAVSNHPCAGARSATRSWVSPMSWAWRWW